MKVTEHVHTVREDPFLQGDGFGDPIRRPVRQREIGAYCQGVGVKVTEQSILSARTCSCRVIASGIRPADQYELARLARALRVSG